MTIDSADTPVRTLRLQVSEVIHETPDSVVVVFDHDVAYRPGQFLTLEIPHPEVGSVARCYSLCTSPELGARPAIAVKRVADGHASNWLCTVTAGTTLSALAPAGTFVPARWDRPLILMAAGSGITPVLSILRTALEVHDQTVTLVYANRDRDSVMFASTLNDLRSRYPARLTVVHWNESEQGLPTAAGLATAVSSAPGRTDADAYVDADACVHADAYLCGPEPFMNLARESLVETGVDPQNIHREVFSSITSNPFTSDAEPRVVRTDSGATVDADVEGENHSFTCSPDTVLLDAMLSEGIDAPFVCREGNCGACAFTLIDGEVEMRCNDTLDDHELARGVRLACQSVPTSDTLTIRID